MLKTLLIDDESLCLDRLDKLLGHYCADTVEIVGKCQTMEAALTAIDTLKPELVFLDVQLSNDITCFSLLNAVPVIDFDVIFVTAWDQYALRAFQVDAIDYLLKPIDDRKLVKAVGKVLARSPKDRIEQQTKLSEVADDQSRQIQRIGIPDMKSKALIFFDLDRIVYCQSDGNYTKFFGKRKDRYTETLLGMASDSLTKFEEALANANFCRIHESHMINLNHLQSYVNGRGGYVVMTDGTELNVSNSRKSEFMARIRGGIF